MTAWLDPVFDRTQEDVDFATQKIAEWITANITGNPLEVYDLKGCLNVSDINRIEGNVAYLSEKLLQYGFSPNTATKMWERDGMPNETDVERILYNVRSLVQSFYKHTNAPDVPVHLQGYNEVNAVEKNLSLIKELLDCMVGSFKSSGTFQSGSTVFLPIRR
jgi:hypothetical protein